MNSMTFPQSFYESFFLAVELNHLKKIEDLINKGLDINYKNEAGMSALKKAILYNNEEALDLLLKHHVKIEEHKNTKKESFLATLITSNNQAPILAKLIAYDPKNKLFNQNNLSHFINFTVSRERDKLFNEILPYLNKKEESFNGIWELLESIYQVSSAKGNHFKSHNLNSFASYLLKAHEKFNVPLHQESLSSLSFLNESMKTKLEKFYLLKQIDNTPINPVKKLKI